MKKIVGALQDLPANQHSQSGQIQTIMAGLDVLVSWQTLKGSHDFLHTFSMALCYKWDVKTFALQFFMLISDGLGGVYYVCHHKLQILCKGALYLYGLNRILKIDTIVCGIRNLRIFFQAPSTVYAKCYTVYIFRHAVGIKQAKTM